MANGSFGGGTGTSVNPYLIEDALDLNAIRNSASSYYKLVNHINLSSYATGTGWNPIPSFTGTLDGNGFTIQNLYINNSASSNLGLFVSLGANGTIINLGLENVLIIGNGTVGGFAGSVVGAGASIRRSYIRGHITATSSFGGFVGSNAQNFVLENCLSYCNLNTTNTGAVNGGGLIGTTSGSGTIKNCLYAGYINGTGTAYGATVGAFTATTFTNVFYDSSLTSKFIASSGAALTATTAKQVTSYTNWHLESIQFRDIKINTKQAINLNALTPVAYWALNGNTNDGYSTKNATAVSMSYINFGTASVANITNSSNRYGYDNIVASNTNLSFCGWYKINPSTKSGNIYDNYVGGFTTKSANGIAYGISTSGKYAIVFHGTTPSNPTGGHLEFESSVGVENKFVHLCLTKEGNTVRLYLNGSKIVENTITHNVGLNFLNTYLNAGGFYRTVSALEYDVMVFNRVLTEQEIQSISTTPIEELVDYQNVSVWKFETGSYPGLWYEKNALVLVKSNNNYKRYKISTDSWLDIQSTYPTQLQFAKNGFRNPSLISRAKWKELSDIGNIDILTLIPENKNKGYLELGTNVIGNARSFNGTSQYFTFTNRVIPTGSKTISFKFKRNGIPATVYERILANQLWTDAAGISIWVVPSSDPNNPKGRIAYYIRQSSTDAIYCDTGYNVCDNIWHEIKFVQDDSTRTVKAYVDGVLTSTTSYNTGKNDNITYSRNLVIGCSYATATPTYQEFFGGSLSDIQILGSTGNIVAYWKMSEATATSNLTDSSTNGYTGTQVGSPAVTTNSGILLRADSYSRSFNGTSDYISFTDKIIPLGAKTISFKIRSNSTSGWRNILNTRGNKSGLIVYFIQNTGTLVFQYRNSVISGIESNAYYISTPYQIVDNSWHEIKFTWDGTTNSNAVKLYIDDMNTPVTTATASSLEEYPQSFNLFVGRAAEWAGDYYNGELKDLKICKGVISSVNTLSNTDTISMPQLIGGGNSEVTLNPSDTISSHTSLSNNNLTLSHVNNGGNYGAARTSQSITSGKWYWEATINNYASLNYVPRLRVGLMTKNVSLDSIYTNSANVAAYDGTYATNDVIGVAVDTVAGTVQFYRNNTLAQTLTGYNFSTAFYPAGGTYGNTPWGAGSHDQITFNFGLSTFVYSPPSGYSSLATNPYQAFGTITVSSRTTDSQFDAYRVLDGSAVDSNFYESSANVMPHDIMFDFGQDTRAINQFTLTSGDSQNLRMPYNFKFQAYNDEKYNYYVNANTGNDTTGDGSCYKPFKTIEKAESLATSGQSIALYGTFVIGTSRIWKSGVSYVGYGKNTILKGSEIQAVSTNKNVSFYRLIIDANGYDESYCFYGVINLYNVAYINSNSTNGTREIFYGQSSAGYEGIFNVQNCLFHGTQNAVRTNATAQVFTTFYNNAFACSGITTTEINAVNNSYYLNGVTFNSDYEITSGGNVNAGFGTDLDGSVANIGLYGGSWTWSGYSNDWNVLYTGTGVTFNLNETKTFSFINKRPYRYYMLMVTSNAPGSDNPNISRIYEMNLFANKKVLDVTMGEYLTNSSIIDYGPYSYPLTQNGTLLNPAEKLFYRLNGRTDKITYPAQVIPTGAKVIQFEIRTSDTLATNKVIFLNDKIKFILKTNGKINVSFTNLLSIDSSITINDGQWHKVMLIWDGTTNSNAVKLYIDNMNTPDSLGTSLTVDSVAYNNLIIGESKSSTISAFYKFENSLLNSSDSTNTLTGVAATYTTGKNGQGFSAGVGKHYYVSNILKQPSTFTIGGWYKVNPTTKSANIYQNIFGCIKATTGSATNIGYGISTDGFFSIINTQEVLPYYNEYKSNISVADTFTHVVLTRNNNTYSLYINGSLATTITYSGMPSDALNFYSTYYNSTASTWFRTVTSIDDEVFVSNLLLSSTDINAIYTNGIESFYNNTEESFNGDLKNLYIDVYKENQLVLDTDSIIDITPNILITSEAEVSNTVSNQSAAVITETSQDIIPTVAIINETEVLNTISNQTAAVVTEASEDIIPTLLITTETATGNSLLGNTSFTTAVPFAKLIKANGDISLESIESIDSLQVTASVSGTGVVKMIASSDSGVTWKSYYNGAWTAVTDTDLSDVKTKGMSPTVFSALTNTEWQQLISSSKKVRFGYYLEIDSASDSASTDKLVLQFDALGSWKAMPYGGDWEYEMISLKRARIYLYANGSYKINY